MGWLSVPSKHLRMNSQLVGDLIEDMIHRHSLYRPIDVIGEVKDGYNMDINTIMLGWVWRMQGERFMETMHSLLIN